MWNDTRNRRRMSVVELNIDNSGGTYYEISEDLISTDEMKSNDDDGAEGQDEKCVHDRVCFGLFEKPFFLVSMT